MHTISPITRLARMVSECNHDCVVMPFDYDDIVREAPEDNSFGSFRSCLAGTWEQRKNILFYEI